jgi:hypothetical protein
VRGRTTYEEPHTWRPGHGVFDLKA